MKDLLKEFKKFVLRGNVVDLAVAVVVGAAFGAVVSSLVKDLITPLLAAIGGQPDFSSLSFTINGSKFLYGNFLNQLISFIILAAVIFFFVVHPLNRLVERLSPKEKAELTDRDCPECCSTVPIKARRCRYCGSAIEEHSHGSKSKSK